MRWRGGACQLGKEVQGKLRAVEKPEGGQCVHCRVEEREHGTFEKQRCFLKSRGASCLSFKGMYDRVRYCTHNRPVFVGVTR